MKLIYLDSDCNEQEFIFGKGYKLIDPSYDNPSLNRGDWFYVIDTNTDDILLSFPNYHFISIEMI